MRPNTRGSAYFIFPKEILHIRVSGYFIQTRGAAAMKILAIDYGDARTGVAVSDLTGSIVGYTTVIHSWNRKKTLDELVWLVKEQGAQRVIMGFPRNMDGSEGPRAELYRAFAADLEAALGMPVRLWDERRTTVEAHNILTETGYHGKKRKNTVDAVAASLILEGYLSYLRLHPEE